MKIYFSKEDIPTLDLILSSLIILNKELSVADDLVKRLLQIDTKDMSKGLDYIEKPFIHYVDIFVLHQVGTKQETETLTLLKANEKTLPFYNQGGFQELYNQFVKNNEYNDKQNVLVGLQIEEIQRNKTISWIALVVSVLSLIVSIITMVCT